MSDFRFGLALLLSAPLAFALGCSNNIGGNGDGGLSDAGRGPCVGRQCDINYSCPGTPTTLTGVVTIPSGKLPLYNAKVYIPALETPDPPATGASCDRCDQVVPPNAAASTTTGIDGRFTLTNVPKGTNIPLIIRVGKWRRLVTIPEVQDCTSTELSADSTRLPKNQSEGNIPKIAISTGRADALECLLRGPKLGLDDAEFTLPSENGRVNLYLGGPDNNGNHGANQYAATFGSTSKGKPFPISDTTWWPTAATWPKYDIVMFSCEGRENFNLKTDTAHYNLQDYVDMGGRVFASHWNNGWFAPVPVRSPKPANELKAISSVATFHGSTEMGLYQDDTGNAVQTDINTSFPKGSALDNWLQSVPVSGANPGFSAGKLPVKYSRQTVLTRDTTVSQDWVHFQPPTYPLQSQYFSFNAPIGASADQQCGQMVFTDIHVSGNPSGDLSLNEVPFPGSCITSTLSPQEKALIFLLFDLTNCLQPIIG